MEKEDTGMIGLVLDATGLVSGSRTRRVRSYAGLALRSLLVCVAYYFGSLLGYALLFPSSYISVIWPPNTVLLVTLLLSQPWQWPWLLLIAFPVHLLAQAQCGASLSAAVLYYAFNCALVPITAAAMRRFGLGDLALGDLRQTLIFIVVTTIAVAVGSLVWSPLIVLLWFGGDVWSAWYFTCLSNLLPFLIATPGLVIGFTRGVDMIRKASLAQYTEFALLALGLLGCGIVIFGLNFQPVGKLPALLYAPLPFLLWAAVRFGPGGVSFSWLIFAFLAVFSAVTGHGPFVTQSAADNVLWSQIFLLAVYLPLLALASVVQERRTKEQELRFSEARYRAVVEDQTELICRFLPDGTYTFVNDAYCRYFQRSREDLLGCSFWRFIPPEGHQAAREFLASITPEHQLATRDHEVLAPSGQASQRTHRIT
jgi:PAS domain S-box-containing protein